MGLPGLGDAGPVEEGTRRERRVASREDWEGLMSSCVEDYYMESMSMGELKRSSKERGKRAQDGLATDAGALSRLWTGSEGHVSRLGPTLAWTNIDEKRERGNKRESAALAQERDESLAFDEPDRARRPLAYTRRPSLLLLVV